MSHLLEDVVFEAGMEIEDILASYHHIRFGVERALECDIPDCHHAGIDREGLKVWYDQQIAAICHQLVDVIMEAM